jgi:drug/metabolite transporter (DMT)-like permease
MNTTSLSPPAKWKLVAGFSVIFLIWGSTYLAIRYAVHTLPPFSMSGARFLIAGLVLYLWAWWRDGARPSFRYWGTASIAGALMMLIGMGAVAWVAQWVPSGLTALLIATNPAWMLLISWLWGDAVRPGWRVWLGLMIGLISMSMLIGPGNMDSGQVSFLHLGVLLLSTIGWVVGSLYSRHASQPASQMQFTAMIMLTGGIWLLIAGGIAGEWPQFSPAQISWTSLLAFAYLTSIGSLLVFTVYVWLMSVASPAHVATHAYVNPVVAIILGWLIGGEVLTIQIILAATGIILGVILMVSDRSGKRVTTGEKLIAVPEHTSCDEELVPETGRSNDEPCAAG